MRNDMQDLVVLWRKERKIKTYREEYYRYKGDVDRRSKSISSSQTEILQLLSERELEEKECQGIEQQIVKVEKDSAVLKKALEQGIVTDYEAAEQQLEQAKILIDTLEEEYLELLEKQESAEKRVLILESRLETDRRLIVQESNTFEINRVRLEKTVSNIRVEQRKISEGMNPKIVERFKRMITNHSQAVSPIVNGHCSYCNVMIPKMLLNDVLIREVIHNCPSCSSFLISSDEII
jgi:uncharacterized protein